MIQTKNKTTTLDLRTRLHEMVVKDLLGPAGGVDEIVDEQNVRNRYIVGLLAPKGQSALPDEQDELGEQGGRDAPEDGKTEAASAPLPVMLPSSMGMTFTVSAEVQEIQVTVRWGQYTRVRSEMFKTAAGEAKPVWQRSQVEASTLLPLQVGKAEPWSPNQDHPEVYLRGLIRQYDGAWSVTLFLVNAQTEPRQSKDEAWVFQPEIIVSAKDGSPVFLKRPMKVQLENEETETQAMRMTYRQQIEFAVGHGIATQAEKLPGQWERAVKIRTVTIPDYEVEQVDAPRQGEIPALDVVQLDMHVLSQLQGEEFVTALGSLPEAYAAWIGEQEARLYPPSDDLREYEEAARSSLSACRTTLRRIREGIHLLATNEMAAAAFRFANRSMALQRVHTLYAREVRKKTKEQVALEDFDIPRNRSWRPFQLAFMLLNIPALLDPTHADRVDPTQAKADLLWFPTGGGKTEAYLGVAAFTLAIRRLQGEIGGYSGHAGVAVLMRYTLRLLTLQQFQRATALICACEMIRREDPAQWGAEPFRIGLWVGQKSTPNWTEDSAEALRQDHGMYNNMGSKGTPLQITNCPWCGRPILPNNLKVEVFTRGRGRTFQFCSDPFGQCPFSEKQSPNEGLPIVVVDEEIYRRLPSFLIATVDKFAQMPWKGETQALFGKVSGYCPRHGYRPPDIDDSDSHPALKGLETKFPAVKTKDCLPLRPPDLIIQDELHLISGPLGTLVGLYETAVDRLCSWEYNGVLVRPKVIASTATIRRAQNQVHNLFLRNVQIFPPSGLDSGDNFFSRRRPAGPEAPGRLYLGICAPGTRMKTILIRVYVAYLAAAQTLFKDYGALADPWMTLVGYFNSMRELGGMRRVTDDAVRTRLRQMDERGMAKRFIEPTETEELTSRKSAGDIPHILDRLEVPFPAKKSEEKPYDVVLATNMISVGVDVGRLGLMVVASQPKATSEYIQATSRVGRAFPGVVCTVYNWARPRDLSHYERFEHYHATFYQQVEALSVTPFSPRALDRGLSGVYVSEVRLLSDQYNANEDAGKVNWPNAMIDDIEKEISRRAGLVTISEKVKELTASMLSARRDEWLNRITAASGGAVLTYQMRRTGRALPLLKQPTEKGDSHFICLNSLRDVEPQVRLILDDHDMDTPPPEIAFAADLPASGELTSQNGEG
jgi:hypothetical protein